MNKEIWKPILGYEGLYEVSNKGNVRSMDYRHTKTIHILKQNKSIYIRVYLCKNGKGKLLSVHRLVARAFPEICGEWFDGCEVDHIDTNKHNNIATNLKVCTKKENNNNPNTLVNRSKWQINGNAYWCNKKGEKHPKSKITLQYTKDGEFIREWVNQTLIQNELGILQCDISRCCNGKRKTAGGFRWEYKKEDD